MQQTTSRNVLAMMLVSGGLAAALPAASPAHAECGAERIDCALKGNADHPCCARKGGTGGSGG